MDSAPLPCSFLFSFLPFGSVPCPPLRTIGRVGFDPRSFSPWDGRSPVSHPTCDVPFPPRRPSEYWKRMIPARPLYQGVKESVWDPETSRERVGDVPLVCCRKACHKAKRRVGVCGDTSEWQRWWAWVLACMHVSPPPATHT